MAGAGLAAVKPGIPAEERDKDVTATQNNLRDGRDRAETTTPRPCYAAASQNNTTAINGQV